MFVLRWRKDPDFEVRNYSDLENLPCLLVVVNKGKMGITYPRSLKYYDLRQKYPRPRQGTRAAIEQAEHPYINTNNKTKYLEAATA